MTNQCSLCSGEISDDYGYNFKWDESRETFTQYKTCKNCNQKKFLTDLFDLHSKSSRLPRYLCVRDRISALDNNFVRIRATHQHKDNGSTEEFEFSGVISRVYQTELGATPSYGIVAAKSHDPGRGNFASIEIIPVEGEVFVHSNPENSINTHAYFKLLYGSISCPDDSEEILERMLFVDSDLKRDLDKEKISFAKAKYSEISQITWKWILIWFVILCICTYFVPKAAFIIAAILAFSLLFTILDALKSLIYIESMKYEDHSKANRS